jgi:hypothetical protein
VQRLTKNCSPNDLTPTTVARRSHHDRSDVVAADVGAKTRRGETSAVELREDVVGQLGHDGVGGKCRRYERRLGDR